MFNLNKSLSFKIDKDLNNGSVCALYLLFAINLMARFCRFTRQDGQNPRLVYHKIDVEG